MTQHRQLQLLHRERVLRRVKLEVRRGVMLLTLQREHDDRARGQVEALRHVLTVIKNQEALALPRPPRKRR